MDGGGGGGGNQVKGWGEGGGLGAHWFYVFESAPGCFKMVAKVGFERPFLRQSAFITVNELRRKLRGAFRRGGRTMLQFKRIATDRRAMPLDHRMPAAPRCRVLLLFSGPQGEGKRSGDCQRAHARRQKK